MVYCISFCFLSSSSATALGASDCIDTCSFYFVSMLLLDWPWATRAAGNALSTNDSSLKSDEPELEYPPSTPKKLSWLCSACAAAALYESMWATVLTFVFAPNLVGKLGCLSGTGSLTSDSTTVTSKTEFAPLSPFLSLTAGVYLDALGYFLISSSPSFSSLAASPCFDDII